MAANEELPVKDVERGSQHIEEKLHYTDINKDDVGYKEYLESLERERLIAVKCVAGNDTGIKNKTSNREEVTVALTDPKAILVCISVFAAAIPNGVVNSFSTIIIRDTGVSVEKSTQLKSVGDDIQVVALLIWKKPEHVVL